MDERQEKLSEEISQSLQTINSFVGKQVSRLVFSEAGIETEVLIPDIEVGQDGRRAKSKNIKLFLDPLDYRSVPFTALRDGFYEPVISRLLINLASNVKVFLDVGANVGYYSIALASAWPRLMVHAVEPNSSLWSSFRRNQSINGLESSIVLHQAGLSNSDTLSQFFVPKTTGTAGGSLRNLHPDEGHSMIEVQLNTADSLGLPVELDLVKIDTEGAEMDVITALLSRIDASSPTLVVELLRKWMAPFGHHPQEVVDLLRSKGYLSHAIGSNAISVIDEINEETVENNFLFIHASNVEHRRILQRFA